MRLNDEDVFHIAEDVWSSVLGLDLRVRTSGDSAGGGGSVLIGSLQITGAWEGVMSLECSSAMARRAAAIMMGVEAERTTPDDVRDALGELANMICGHVKVLLPSPSRQSLPSVTEGRVGVEGASDLRPAYQLAFECQGEPVRVSVERRGEGPAAEGGVHGAADSDRR